MTQVNGIAKGHVSIVTQENTNQVMERHGVIVCHVHLGSYRSPARRPVQNASILVILVNAILARQKNVSIVPQENTNQVLDCNAVIVCHVHLGAPRFPARRPLQNVSATLAMQWVVLISPRRAAPIKCHGVLTDRMDRSIAWSVEAVMYLKVITGVKNLGIMR